MTGTTTGSTPPLNSAWTIRKYRNPATAAQPISWFATYYKFGDLVKVTIGKPRFNDYTDFTVIEGQNFKRFGDSDFMGILQLFPTTGLTVAAASVHPGYLGGVLQTLSAGVAA